MTGVMPGPGRRGHRGWSILRAANREHRSWARPEYPPAGTLTWGPQRSSDRI